MSRPLNEYFSNVMESDIEDYGDGNVVDFLNTEINRTNATVHWVITNPPFNKAQQFIEKAHKVAIDGVAMLVRTTFLEGVMRYQTLFLKNPPDVVAQFSERVPMVKGRCDAKASTATSYAWLVWYIDNIPDVDKATLLQWIPPCRKQLERKGDYDNDCA
ncbi:MAG: methyltransferase [Methylocystaceae bacterium]|nr:methyltransferase [Methylocystaceae bacterium]